MAVVQKALQGYQYVFDELSDPRTKEWLFVSGPGPLLTILASYLYFCTKAGPRYMETRKPYNLKNVVMLYNILQIILSVYITYLGLYFVLTEKYANGCYSVDTSERPTALLFLGFIDLIDCQKVMPKDFAFGMAFLDSESTTKKKRAFTSCSAYFDCWASGVWLFYFGKITELLDTVFFVLRKKNRQISFLHLYHHTIMPIVGFIGIKYAAGGQSVPEGSINSFIHVIMYTYYLISGLGPQYQKYLWWKKYLTTMQLIQFCIVAFLNVNSFLSKSCNYPKYLSLIVLTNCIAFFYMFGMFYYENYITAKNKKENASKKDL